METNTMTLEQFCQGIQLGGDIQEKIIAYEIEKDDYASYWNDFRQDETKFFERIKEKEDEYLFALALYCRMACDVYPQYREKGISRKVYFDTFMDIRIWCDWCMRRKGIVGLMEYEWVAMPLALRIVRLGRLQFAPEKLMEDMTIEIEGKQITIAAGTKIIDVHIPEGGPLDEESCNDSFAKARKFFGDSYHIYMCTSWILAPILGEWIGKETNLMKFQRRFRIVDVVYPLRQAEERVFGEIRKDPENYPENNHLQRMLKQYVLDGKDAGLGVGILIVK